jgi:hypothetical protein
MPYHELKRSQFPDVSEIDDNLECSKCINVVQNFLNIDRVGMQYYNTRECCLDPKLFVMRDYVVVSESFWNFLIGIFGGGPAVPLYPIQYS